MLHPSVCGYSPRPPVSVSSTGTCLRLRDAFLGSVKRGTSPTITSAPHHGSRLYGRADLPTHPPLAAWPGSTNAPVACSSCVPPRRLTSGRWLRNINLIPISYAFRPRLRPRLTLGGFAFPRKPWASDGQASHLPRATYSGILTSASSTLAFALGFSLPQNAPLPLKADYLGFKPDASVCGLKPRVFSAPSRSTSELLRTL